MRVVLIIALIFFQGLGVFPQSLTKDPNFQFFFNIRSGLGSGYVNDIWEDPNNGVCYATGTFGFTLPNQVNHGGLTSFLNDGSNNANFRGLTIITNRGAVFPINDTALIVAENGFYLPMDFSGNLLYLNWRTNVSKTVTCKTGFFPYFFTDGSSLMANGSNNTGNPCDIINPPDTFPGRHIVKVDPQGNWDSSFVKDANHNPRGFAPYDSNRLLVFGFPNRFTHYDGHRVNGLCRIFLDGTLDTTFQSPLQDGWDAGGFNPSFIEGDGGFFLQGNFKLQNDTSSFTLVRLNQDGSIDSSFRFTDGPYDTIPTQGGALLVPTEDGGYIVYGLFNRYQGHTVNSIAKVDSLGNLEPQYFTSLGPDSSRRGTGVPAVIFKVLPSVLGGYYVVGDFLKWDGLASQPIIRLTGLTTGINEVGKAPPRVNVYPNPSSLEVYINSDRPITELELFDLLGRSIFQKKANKILDEKVNLEDFENGIYLLKIKTARSWITKKIIKQ